MAQKSDLTRAFTEDGPRRTHVGGQALIEGVMMRGKYNWAVGVREPDGTLHAEEHALSRSGARPGWMSWPLVRGCVALVDSLVLGYKALEIAANHAFDDEDEDGAEPDEAEPQLADERSGVSDPQLDGRSCDGADAPSDDEHPFSWKDDFGRPGPVIEALGAQASLEVVHEPIDEPLPGGTQRSAALERDARRVAEEEFAAGALVEDYSDDADEDEPAFGKGEMAISLVLGLVLGVALFILLPAFLSNLIVGDYESQPLAWNIVDGVVRVAIFVFYVWLIGRLKDIHRMFSYHGAEHKTIHCYEHGLALTPENARSFPRLHVRCGTAFLIMVMIIAILVYTVVPLDALIAAWGFTGPAAFAVLIVARIVLMPVIAGISYEITVKWAGSHPESPLVRVVLWPGMQMQRLTTNEPDDGMLECAIAAMKLVLEREEREAAAQ